MKKNRKYKEEAEEETTPVEVKIDLNKPNLPDFIDTPEDLNFWLRKFGETNISVDRVLNILSSRISKSKLAEVAAALTISNSEMCRIYKSGIDSSDFELRYAMQMRANSADKEANDATDMLLKLNRVEKIESEIKKRFS